MIPVNNLITKLNASIATGGLSSLELAQVFGAIESLEKSGIGSVVATINLPPAADNKGRFIYITSEIRYVFSNGITWDINNILRKPDVNAYAWGSGSSGVLGDGTITTKSSPVSVVGGFTNWTQISAGSAHNLGLRADGTAWAWGSGANGRLGDGTTVSKSSPVSVIGGFTDWIQVSAGINHSLAIRANGTAWAWGVNGSGILGDGTVISRLSPVSVVGGFTNWIQVSGKSIHSLGLRADGTAWAWGSGAFGVLGDGTTVSKSSPVSVIGGFTDWVQISAGNNHSLGVRANGTAWGWGYNGGGRLGDGTTVSKSSPVSVVGGFTDWIQVSAAGYHSLGLRADGTAWAWGQNSQGRLGDNTTTSRLSPVAVVGGFTDWTQLIGGLNHSLGLRADGTAWAWGQNTSGQLGDSTGDGSRLSPVAVVGGFTNWVQVSGGSLHSVGVKS